MVGGPAPKRLRVRVYQDSGLPRRYWDGVMVFAKRRPGQPALAVLSEGKNSSGQMVDMRGIR